MPPSPKSPAKKLSPRVTSAVKSAEQARLRRGPNTELSQFLAMLDRALLVADEGKVGHKVFQKDALKRLRTAVGALGMNEAWEEDFIEQAKLVLDEYNKNVDNGLDTKIFLI